jgi:hypothetical protein
VGVVEWASGSPMAVQSVASACLPYRSHWLSNRLPHHRCSRLLIDPHPRFPSLLLPRRPCCVAAVCWRPPVQPAVHCCG